MSSLKKWRLPGGWLRAFIFGLTIFVTSRMYWMISLSTDLPNNVPPFTVPPLPSNGGEMISIQASNETTFYRHSHFWVDFPLCLVHVGKAAGSSVSCGLGLTYADCEGMPRDRIDHTHFFHMRRNNCPETTRTFAVALRNPLQRLQSWFDFEKDIVPTRGKDPKAQQQVQARRAMLFRDCYPTFELLVLEGLKPLPGNGTILVEHPKDMSCQERAWAAVLGVRAFSYHEWYNYEYYWTGIQERLLFQGGSHGNELSTSSPVLLALRTEHLSQDWRTLSKETLFRPVNRRKIDSNTTFNTHTSHTFLAENVQARQQLCRALCPEIQYYKRFLVASQNLNSMQKQESLKEVQGFCPLETSLQVRDCPGLPHFPRMRVPARQYRTEIKKRLYEKVH